MHMGILKKFYIGFSIVPLALFFLTGLYNMYSTDRNTLIPSMEEISYLSLGLGIVGILLVVRALIKKEPIQGLVLATILSSSIALFFLSFGIAWIL
ncbi:hypothetical protein A3H65_04345 [Candidatus Giovannonibacteria bacterium RIFCSPLOWO2_02_FULL_45_14]|nr:MAG: hypothetical protein A3C75_00430 [Candidatus Giovannonibacteria bacterium RIFCSPHIGHO2_02_FULL_44_31]OGF76774.1 MAG: hypothetical protein A3E62_00970 [Candidatus Giovannonibacteria bacterium RIFCSPHIGHO2_12_FULL_44_29]OGF91059.1 MAG: hypothetical protein A3H65_04345 [Candidatus Giovannonibacteria bacterium RIFCSPLOWO2_02_FULL_45_14]